MVTQTTGRLFRLVWMVALAAGAAWAWGAFLAWQPAAWAAGCPGPACQASPAAGRVALDVQGSLRTLAGRVITYTLFITNESDQVVSNLVLTDAWGRQRYNGNYLASGGLAGVSAAYITTVTQPYIRWSLPALPARASGSIVMTMWVSSTLQPASNASPTLLPNVAAVTHTTSGVDGSQDALDTLVIGPVISFTKTYTPAALRPGRLMTYVLRVANEPDSQRPDAIAATGVTVYDRVPASADIWRIAGAAAAEFSPTTRLLAWTLTDTLVPGAAVNLTLTLRLSETLRNAGDVNLKIRNLKADRGVLAAELPITIQGDVNVLVLGEDAVEKAVQVGPPPPEPSAQMPQTFPNRVVTYTLAVYNPLTQTAQGILVTDTFPQYPAGGPYFQYLDTFPVAPFAAPQVVTAAGRMVVWALPDVEAWGVYTFGVRAQAPAQMDTARSIGRVYDNAVRMTIPLAGSVIYDNQAPVEARLRVLPQVLLDKAADPRSQQPGRSVVFTFTASNAGATAVRDAWLTDTLPADFRFAGMIDGPAPLITTPVGWPPATIAPYGTLTYTYRAIVDGTPLMNHCSTLGGFSADTFVPSFVNQGCVYVLSPFELDKVAAPSSFVLGQTFSYDITLVNVGDTAAVLTTLQDVLPPGFYTTVGAAPVFTETYNPPVTLTHGAPPFSRSFSVEARTVERSQCNRLPSTIEQPAGAIAFQIANPPLDGTWYNAGILGGAMVLPQAHLSARSQLPGAEPGGLITYTLFLTNDTATLWPRIVITDILPAGFQYRGAVDFRPPDQIVAGTNVQLVWRDMALPASGAVRIQFVALAGMAIGDGRESPILAASVDRPDLCIPWLGVGGGARPGPRVNVRLRQFTFTKVVTPTKVSRLGLVQYDVALYNKGPYAADGAIITDLLPAHPSDPDHPFLFVAMKQPVPDGVELVSTAPPAWRIASLDTNRNVKFSFYAAATQHAASNYVNVITGASNIRWAITPELVYTGAPVEVLGTIAPFSPSDLAITQTASAPAVAGGRLTYTLIFSNAGPYPADAVVITDLLPVSLTQVAVATAGAVLTPAPGAAYAWSAGNLKVGAWGVITLAGQLSAPIPIGARFSHTAVIVTLNGLDPAPENNAAPVEVTTENAPPVIRPIGDRIVAPGRTLSFQVVAADADGDPLVYALEPGAPAGAAVDSASGVFTWVVALDQPLGVYPVTVRATDNRSPPLSAAATFAVTVGRRQARLPLVLR